MTKTFKITISDPKMISEGNFAGVYACQVYLPDRKISSPIYADNSDDATNNANRFVKIYLEGRIKFLENSLKEKETNVRKKLTEELE